MINILLGYLIIGLMIQMIFKPKNNILSCGLFGWQGEDPKDCNIDKVDKLGIYNDTRGGHSCGISIDGEITIGTGDQKLYYNFIKNFPNPVPTVIPSVMGHTRWATGGAHNQYNAHPFGFDREGNKKDYFDFVGIHNGSLKNHTKLAEKYGIDLKEGVEFAGTKVTKTREKIDSEVLLEIIFKTRNVKVLSEYIGAAALVWRDMEDPECVYYYHGKSKEYKSSKEAKEERPLFYYKESKTNIYFSSLKESLISIGGSEETIHQFKHNTVYKVKNGDIKNAEKITISRNKATQKKEYNWEDNGYSNYNKKPRGSSTNSKIKEIGVRNVEFFKRHGVVETDVNIFDEKDYININDYKGKIYFNKLRYCRNGHTCKDGIYTFIPKFGLYYLGESPKDAEQEFFNCVNKYFLHGDFITDTKVLKKFPEEAYIPFPSDSMNEITRPKVFYIYKGIRLLTKYDYLAALDRDGDTNLEFSYRELSDCSTHPVIDFASTKGKSHQGIIFKKELVTDTFSPIGSDKIYTVKDGNLVKLEAVRKSKSAIETFEDAKRELDEFIDEKSGEKMMVPYKATEDTADDLNSSITDDLLEEDLDEIFLKSYRDFPRFIKKLKTYNSKKAKDAINILETFIIDSKSIVAVDLED